MRRDGKTEVNDPHLGTRDLNVPALECVDHERSPRVVQRVQVCIPAMTWRRSVLSWSPPRATMGCRFTSHDVDDRTTDSVYI